MLIDKLIGIYSRVGIAMGPRTWFGNRSIGETNFGGTVIDNRFEGAVSAAIHEPLSFAYRSHYC